MKNRLFLILSLVVLSVKLNAQYSASDATFIYQVDGTRVLIAPNINIPAHLVISYDWTFGDGTQSNVADPGDHDYLIPGTYRVSLSVQYLDMSGATSYSTTLGDINVLATVPFVKWITVGDDSSPPPSTGIDPQIVISGTTYPDVYFNVDCSINNPVNERYRWSLYVDDVFVQDVISVEEVYSFSLVKSEGVYNLELLVEKYNDANTFSWSNPATINVGYNNSSCQSCMAESVISPTITTIKEGIADVKFNYYTATWASDQNTPDPPFDECFQIRTSPVGYNITQFWTAINEEGQEFPIGTTNYSLDVSNFDIPLSLNLSAGDYFIKCKTGPSNGEANETEHCYLYTEATTKLKVKPELSLENPQFPESPTPETPYNLDFPFSGGTETVVIRGTETITSGADYRSKGSIMVDGDWINIDRFTHQELIISCGPSESEDRFGRIIVTFPNTYEQKIIYVTQPRSFWEVENNDDLAVAIQNVEDGSKIILNEGTYNVSIEILGKNITLTSKFLETGDPFYIDNTIIDANNEGSVVKLVGNGSFEGTAKIIGMHLTGGNAEKGGGIYCSNANLDLEHVLIHGSYGGKGGGIYASNANINANHITLTGNDSEVDADTGWVYRKFGHIIYLKNSSEITIRNSIVGSGVDNYMGGIYYPPISNYTQGSTINLHYSRTEGSTGGWMWPANGPKYSSVVWISDRFSFFNNDYKLHNTREIGFEDQNNQNYWLGANSFYRYKGDDDKDLVVRS